jgi:hypothetical protein
MYKMSKFYQFYKQINAKSKHLQLHGMVCMDGYKTY